MGAFETCTTSIHERSSQDVNVFPNPATDHIQVSFPTGDIPRTLEVFDPQGRLLRSWPVNGGRILTLDVRDLPSGIMLLRAGGPEGTTTLPFVKQ